MSQGAETGGTKSAKDGELASPSKPRRPYQAPRLECHGRLAELTRFGGSQILDSGGGLGNQPG